VLPSRRRGDRYRWRRAATSTRRTFYMKNDPNHGW
jgi:hypothetical protein